MLDVRNNTVRAPVHLIQLRGAQNPQFARGLSEHHPVHLPLEDGGNARGRDRLAGGDYARISNRAQRTVDGLGSEYGTSRDQSR